MVMTPEHKEKMRLAKLAKAHEPKKKRPSMRKAIDGYCKGCIYDSLAPGTWRQQVTSCTATDCSLYELRPRTTPKGA